MEVWDAKEKLFDKLDTGAIKDMAQALKLIEGMKRSMENILTMEQKNRIEHDKRKLAIEEQRLELEKRKADADEPDREIKVVIGGYEEEWSE